MINSEKRKIQEEAINALAQNQWNGIVILPTGTGKTYVLIEAIKRLYQPGMSVLYTCDSQILRDKTFNDELDKWGAGEYKDIIEKKCYASAYKLENEYRDILLADEGDYALTPEYSKLFFRNKFRYIIFVSATLDTRKRTLASKIAPIIYFKKPKDIEGKGVVNRSQLIIVPFMLNEAENNKYLWYNSRFKELLNEQPPPFADLEGIKNWQNKRQKNLDFLTLNRTHFLAGLESSFYICRKLMKELYLQNSNCRMLIFCGLNSQADKVCKYSYHSQNEELQNLEKFNLGEINACSVCGKVDRGQNLNGVDNIIMENCTRSETKMIQRIGRGKRLAIDKILNVYLLIPYYTTTLGKRKATIVYDKVMEATKNLGIENAKVYYVK